MSRTIIAVCTAIAAIAAFAIVSTASANPVLTHPTGTVVPQGIKVKGTNVGSTTFVTSLGSFGCTAGQITAVVTTNETARGTEAELTSASLSNCTTWAGAVTVTTNPPTNGLPWCLEATSASDEGFLRGGGCASVVRPIRFVLDFSFGECTYQRATAARSTLRTDVAFEDATFSLKEQEWTLFSGGSLCATSFLLNATFTMETDSTSAEPMYFSA
jgi:hypothetical protein